MRYAVGDVHGFRDELTAALRGVGLIDAERAWSGGTDEVWFMGDLLDRGPDGAAVIADVMRWQIEARAVGGFVGSVLGNHEVLALGVRRFGDRQLPGGAPGDPPRSFASSWLANGGQSADQRALTDEAVQWLASLPAMVTVGNDLLQHSDTLAYLEFGNGVVSVNRQIHAILHGDDLAAAWSVWRAMTTRFMFLGAEGQGRAELLLSTVGADRIVHGHSLVSDLLDIDPTEVDGPLHYAGDRVLGVDGGIYAGGPCLVVEL